MDKYEVAVLADDYHTKKRHFENLGVMNTQTDPDKAREQTIQYEVARAEMMGAWMKLNRAQCAQSK